MWDDARLDTKLGQLSRDLMVRSPVPGFRVVDMCATAGLDETGKPGFFAAVLLAPEPAPEFGTLSAFRQVITARLKQLDSRLPAFPIVVQGAPEVIRANAVVPGGREAYEQVKLELFARRRRLHPNRPSTVVDHPGLRTRKDRALPEDASKARKPPTSKKLPARKVAAKAVRRAADPKRRTRA